MDGDKVFLISFIVMVIFVVVALITLVPNWNWESKEENVIEYNQAYSEFVFCERTTKLVSRENYPDDYTCEQIKMIIAMDAYPTSKEIFNCKKCEDCEETWGHSREGEFPKVFKTYYILNCVDGEK